MHITFNRVSANYQLGPIKRANILTDLSAEVKPGSFTAVIGPTGAGKSSLLKLINGLLLPSVGEVSVGEVVFTSKASKQALKQVRKRVGMAFQFPEHQLFAETVYEDLAFGPRNFHMTDSEIDATVKHVCQLTGIDQSLLERSPFSLSGGQQRRVAIAGILATKPDILVLDEPAAGLDPAAKKQILEMLSNLHRTEKLTTLMVTHDMDDVVHYADDVIVMAEGQIKAHLDVRSLFADQDLLDRYQLDVPTALSLQQQLEQAKGERLNNRSLTLTELADNLIEEGWV
ncbi:energy-coupling factor transporter ATP-binding protein EcfA2 [Halolactibacillus miurensis]|uniref:Energy-coupling factor transporter ATP-binding protein EcfA2 n=1 Tax=Halolactibacillus miurensis TaxID=306541 RepID=A0A1I6TGQ2_9BACI|nr:MULTISPECIES: energy-coupling factor transporter ATPase [Halolactibacillus]GEM04652.1 energy-coupling factor transporter ATP-binding protein EcfA2 [Halolactibacillus miurensis]SFS88360.1 energy-coupling factor transport system ATP-binding protein [Halolactibacillus miurensis]